MRRIYFIVLFFTMFFLLSNCARRKSAWWVNAVFYQIYPLSFQDSDGNGYGDLRGIIDRVSYLKSIGVTAVWLTPIFDSPMKDNGYDISDYYSIHPIYGTMEDFIELERVLEINGIMLLLDLVPNHTSDQHPWFKKSINREGEYEDYYIWHKGKGFDNNGKPIPPNNWIDWMNSGSAWEWSEVRQEFYLHNFLKFQPELDFRNKKVVEEFKNIIKFWFEKGVDGFRVDSIAYIIKDAKFRDEPLKDPSKPRTWNNVDHIYTNNQPEVFDVIKEIGDYVAKLIEKDTQYRVLFLEAHVELEQKVKYYGGLKIFNTPRFILPFNFLLESDINEKSNAKDFKRLIESWMDAMPKDDVATWVIGHHDERRVASKMGEEFVDTMIMISFVLPGISIAYYGDEIGMHDTFVPFELSRDHFGIVLGPEHFDKVSRDFYRTPMQWDDSISAGFSNNETTWLPVNANYWHLNVKEQQESAASHLKVFQQMVKAKKTPTLRKGSLEVLAPDRYTLIIKREFTGYPSYMLVVNTGYFMNTIQLSDYGLRSHHKVELVTASQHSRYRKGGSLATERIRRPNFMVTLRPRAAILLKATDPAAKLSRILSWMYNLPQRMTQRNKY